MKRYVVANDVRSNASLGARTEAVIISKSVEKLALRAASTFGYDVAGVDIIEAENSLFVLEVNRTPQWQGLKKTLSIKPEEAIIEMCIKKHASLQ
jgi:glutathione synthase/RimK-type ligase-like ATP-grasp enzyme